MSSRLSRCTLQVPGQQWLYSKTLSQGQKEEDGEGRKEKRREGVVDTGCLPSGPAESVDAPFTLETLHPALACDSLPTAMSPSQVHFAYDTERTQPARAEFPQLSAVMYPTNLHPFSIQKPALQLQACGFAPLPSWNPWLLQLCFL